MQLMHNAIRELQVWNQLLVICLNTPRGLLGGVPCISGDQAIRVPIERA